MSESCVILLPAMRATLIFATRPSALARWQTWHVIRELQARFPNLGCDELHISTQGDRILDVALPEIGGKGLFTHELEQALMARLVQAAVHSLKDLPTEETPGLTTGAILPRADVHDVLICPTGHTLATLPPQAVVGTSSNRRRAQLLAYRRDLQIQSIRGNIDTRIRKAMDGQYDAIVLAAAGVSRLGLQDQISQTLPLELMLPAPGQGALAVQCRSDDPETLEYLGAVDDPDTRRAVQAERAFLAALGGGCALPVAALAQITPEGVTLRAMVASLDGSQVIRLAAKGMLPEALGASLAEQALNQGARQLLSGRPNNFPIHSSGHDEREPSNSISNLSDLSSPAFATESCLAQIGSRDDFIGSGLHLPGFRPAWAQHPG